jgi:hypothetical protein
MLSRGAPASAQFDHWLDTRSLSESCLWDLFSCEAVQMSVSGSLSSSIA